MTIFATLRDYALLNGRILYWIFAGGFEGRPVDIGATLNQMVRIGVQAFPMAALTALSIGLTLAMQGAEELARMGAESYVPDLVSITILRELGPLLIGVVVIGRSGSAITAELGTMKVGEEIEALEVMGINPVRFLVVPRFLAMLVMLPVLAVFGNYIAIAGGWLVCHFALEMNTAAYVLRLIEAAHPMDLYSGIAKSFVFGWIIATISSFAGLQVTGGAEGVGQATTSSVVTSIIAMLIANAILTAVFFIA